MADKQPEALELAEAIQYDVDIGWLIETGCDQVADKLRRQHALIAELVGALENLILNISEAMRTGGWVPSPLHASFFEALSEASDALAKAKEAQQ